MTDEHGMQVAIRESLDFFLSGRILNGQIAPELAAWPQRQGRQVVDELMYKYIYPETGETWDDMEETIFHELENEMTMLGIARSFDSFYQTYKNSNKKLFIKNRLKKIFSEGFLYFENRIAMHLLYRASSSLVKMHESYFADIMTVYRLGGMPCGFEGAPFRSRLIVYVPS